MFSTSKNLYFPFSDTTMRSILNSLLSQDKKQGVRYLGIQALIQLIQQGIVSESLSQAKRRTEMVFLDFLERV
jgi:hypothetical protein